MSSTIATVLYPNNVPEVQERSERSGCAERSEGAEKCYEHSWACSGHVAKTSVFRLNIGSDRLSSDCGGLAPQRHNHKLVKQHLGCTPQGATKLTAKPGCTKQAREGCKRLMDKMSALHPSAEGAQQHLCVTHLEQSAALLPSCCHGWASVRVP